MFAVPSPLRRTVVVLLVAAVTFSLAGLTGCGKEKEKNPYVYTTLARVMDGDTLSQNFLFEIDPPQLEYARGDVGIVRDDHRLEFLVGPDVEHNYATWTDGRLDVQKRFSPTPHLFMMGVRRGEVFTRVDSVEHYVLPKVIKLTKQQLETPGAPLPDLNWKRLSTFENFLPKEDGDPLIEVQSIVNNFVHVPRHDLPEERRANPAPEDYAWYAVFPNATLRLVDVGPGAEYMLELLKTKNLPLVGSFSLVDVAKKYTERAKTYGDLGHVCGTMKINWFRYGGAYIKGDV